MQNRVRFQMQTIRLLTSVNIFQNFTCITEGLVTRFCLLIAQVLILNGKETHWSVLAFLENHLTYGRTPCISDRPKHQPCREGKKRSLFLYNVTHLSGSHSLPQNLALLRTTARVRNTYFRENSRSSHWCSLSSPKKLLSSLCPTLCRRTHISTESRQRW